MIMQLGCYFLICKKMLKRLL